MTMIELNQTELSVIEGGDALDDYINNPYLNPLGGGFSPPYMQPPGGSPDGMPNFY